ncbi:MAG: hypothetical protein GTO51_09330 [Candidatus Latescibacteria bacterium]|nr:hypothetical protein [Candidatus Latescibacterota bacterium]NIM22344.1 hypothetical protein [Candidatus Latescibacterota bacterium]NIM66174.1 hypothetical protein [Candidatus Latescibacterota bacterium]NIO02582.1 hypothetical protein [Candidatus Latescibacterota bacterium]NIO29496.1 hypothetical protein [Candidatus Latescibacterota bacterium]
MNQRGFIDLSQARLEEIEKLEARLSANLDMPAERQAVLHQWLIELYVSVGRLNDAMESFEKILSFYPYDVRIRNMYAEFLIDKLKDTQKAHEILRDSIAYGRHTAAASDLMGQTFFLLGTLQYSLKSYERAIGNLEEARLLLGEEVTSPVLRTLGRSYYLLGKYDDAADVYLELIGREKGFNSEDINFLETFLIQTEKYREKSISETVAIAVTSENRRQRERHEALGAEIVSIVSQDGFPIEGTLYRGTGSGAALFVPDLGHTRLSFDVYAQLVRIAGINALTIDLRGHGGSKNDSLRSSEDLAPSDLARFPGDIASALHFMTNTLVSSGDEIVIVAEGSSCGVVEEAIYRTDIAPAVLYLSPSFDLNSRELYNAIAFRRDRPILFIYSAEDIVAARSYRYFIDVKPFSHLETYPLKNAGHGVEALKMEPKALTVIEKWITERVQLQLEE